MRKIWIDLKTILWTDLQLSSSVVSIASDHVLMLRVVINISFISFRRIHVIIANNISIIFDCNEREIAMIRFENARNVGRVSSSCRSLCWSFIVYFLIVSKKTLFFKSDHRRHRIESNEESPRRQQANQMSNDTQKKALNWWNVFIANGDRFNSIVSSWMLREMMCFRTEPKVRSAREWLNNTKVKTEFCWMSHIWWSPLRIKKRTIMC